VGAFNTTTPVSEGQQISPGDIIHQTVTFTPTVAGAQSAVYSITGDDGQGAIAVQLTGTGVTGGTGTTNLAAGKPTSASTTQGGYPSSNVTDNDARVLLGECQQRVPAVDPGRPGCSQQRGQGDAEAAAADRLGEPGADPVGAGSLDGSNFSTLAASSGYTFDRPPATP